MLPDESKAGPAPPAQKPPSPEELGVEMKLLTSFKVDAL